MKTEGPVGGGAVCYRNPNSSLTPAAPQVLWAPEGLEVTQRPRTSNAGILHGVCRHGGFQMLKRAENEPAFRALGVFDFPVASA